MGSGLENARVLHWECEEVAIPFDALENAPLFSLLSEGGRPHDHGFLFLAISEIISMYNAYSEQLARFCVPINDPATHRMEINPRFIIRGYGNAIKIGAVTPLTEECLNWVAECSWDSGMKMFNMEKLDNLLHNMIDLHDQPALISNPLDFLRQNFVFRDSDLQTWDVLDANIGPRVDHFGNFFANRQDEVLADEIYQLLVLLDLPSGEETIRRTIMDHFHCLDYEQIRQMLEGCRTVLGVLHDTHSKVLFDSLGSFLDNLVYNSSIRVDMDPWCEMGFPSLDDSQIQFVRSLTSNEFVELLLYCMYQMASEAYLFSNLPLFMKDPYTFEMQQDLKHRLEEVCGRLKSRAVADSLEIFDRDILAFYEKQLMNGAAKTNELLQPFLCSNNFCDDSDLVFAALPPTTTVRNYVSLRQTLHQLRLLFLSRSSDINPELSADQKASSSLHTISQGRCWLWEEKIQIQENSAADDIDVMGTSACIGPNNDRWKLWFEKQIPRDEAVFIRSDPTDANGIPKTAANSDSSSSSLKDVDTARLSNVETTAIFKCINDRSDNGTTIVNAAKRVQTWWRRVSVCTHRNEFTYEVCNDDEDDEKGTRSQVSIEEIVEKSISCETPIIMVHPPSCDVSNLDLSYGSESDEMRMRQCLEKYTLPQILGDHFLTLGVRSVNDICMLLSPEIVNEESIQSWLKSLPLLDRMKLQRLVQENKKN